MSLLNEFSIQLYSLREETQKDFLGVLKKLGEIGYTGVEFAGYGNIPAAEMKKTLDANNLKSIGSHVGLDRLVNNWEDEMEYNKTLGTEYIIVPFAELKTAEEAISCAKKMNEVAEKCRNAGFKFGYHNHSDEFVMDGGKYLLDILFEHLDKTNTFMELDIYWTVYAGVDPLEYISKNQGLVKLLHIKQIKDQETKQCVDLDEGIINFKDIISKAKASGVEQFILEQEEFAVSAFVSVEKGFKHIMSL